MTTTSQQPNAGEPAPGGPSGGDPVHTDPVHTDPVRPGSPRHGRRSGPRGVSRGVTVALAVVLVAVVAAAVWAVAAGPFSSSGRAERAVEETLHELSRAESFADFNSHLCAENRVPQELVDTISDSGTQTGTDLDAMFLESIAGSFPENLKVTDVEVGADGSEATATVESDTDGTGPEQVRMRNEDGAWKVCEPGVGMGAVPQEGQAG